jgi:pheromone shutdown protein TraB
VAAAVPCGIFLVLLLLLGVLPARAVLVRALMVWMLVASAMSCMRAVLLEVTRTSNGRTHRGMPAAVEDGGAATNMVNEISSKS